MPDPTQSPRLVPEVVARWAARAIEDLQSTEVITHPAEQGRAREDVLRRFISEFLPASYGVDTGFVVCGDGSKSRQIDIIVHRIGYHPIFSVGGVKHFPVESIVAVMENKARIDSKDRLLEALENVSSAKRLDRSAFGTNDLISGSVSVGKAQPDRFDQQILSFIIAQSSMTTSVVHATLLEWMNERERRLWLNMYVDVRKFTGLYIHPSEAPGGSRLAGVRSDVATDFCIFDEQAPAGSPLVSMAHELLSFCRIAPLIDYHPVSYLGVQGVALLHRAQLLRPMA